MPEQADQAEGITPHIRLLHIQRFRGIEKLIWRPGKGVNILLGGGDVCKTTVLEAIALLLNPTNASTLSDADYWQRKYEDGFIIGAVMALPLSCGIAEQRKSSWPWDWNGKKPVIPNMDANEGLVNDPVYCLRVCGTPDFELQHEILQPDDAADHLPVSVRRKIGLVRLSGDDRNDRDLRLIQGSALERLLSDKTLRSRLGNKLAETDVKGELKEEAKDALSELDKRFSERALPHDLSLGLVGGPGFSLNALIGLTAVKGDAVLPLASWGAGTRRLAALEVAAAHTGDHPIMVVDEIERGLESYRQRVLMEELIAGPSQVFVTTHSAPAVSAADGADLWYVDVGGAVGSLPETTKPQQRRDPETFLSRLAIIAEGMTEVGFVTTLINRSLGEDMRRHGIWVTNGNSNTEALTVLRDLAYSGLKVGGFADSEGTDNKPWAEVKEKLGDLLMRWQTGCMESNLIPHVADEHLEAFIQEPDGYVGERLRTLFERIEVQEMTIAAISAVIDIRALMIEAAKGSPPADPDADASLKKSWRKHGQRWFKSYDGGVELCEKMFAFGLWPHVQGELLPFVNAVRAAVGLPTVKTVN